MTEPKFKIGQRVIVSIPLGDRDYQFDGWTGEIEDINTLTILPEYDIKLDNGYKTGLHFLESDLEPYSDEKIVERTIGLKCPECGKSVSNVLPVNNGNMKIKVVIFECLFSATFNLWDNLVMAGKIC